MKLSEAMRAGEGKVPTCRSHIFKLRSGSPVEVSANILAPPGALQDVAANVCACPLGQALVGKYGSIERALSAAYIVVRGPKLMHVGPATLLERTWPELRERGRVRQPCECSGLTAERPTLRRLIEHLVDAHDYPASRVAELLEETSL